MLHHAAGNADKAFEAYSAVMAAQPSGPVAYNNAAALAAERKIRLDDALIWARKATSLAPEESAFVGTLGMVHAARGETAEAINSLEQAAALKSPRAETLFLLGELRERGGQKDAAAEAYRKALTIDPAFKRAGDAKARLDRLGRSS
jgi:tetratricopeptide (TPR) repeat protein